MTCLLCNKDNLCTPHEEAINHLMYLFGKHRHPPDFPVNLETKPGDGDPTTIRKMQFHVHSTALGKGWWPGGTGKFISTGEILEKIALVHSELSEAVEVAREAGAACPIETTWFKGRKTAIVATEPKPEGFGIELADAVIRIMDLCGALGIDLEKCIQIKAAYNLTRPQRHGGKAA